jgi:peptide deformylase
MIRPILRYGADVLHGPAAPVAGLTDDLQHLIDDMIQTMYAAPGIGLAAPQVGVPLRIFVCDVSVGRNPSDLLAFVNPEFGERDGMQLEEEGCLSVPGFNATVARPARVVLMGLNREGREQVVDASGLLARCFQHEMDHLEGTVFVDRLRGLQKDLIVRKIKKLSRSGKW